MLFFTILTSLFVLLLQEDKANHQSLIDTYGLIQACIVCFFGLLITALFTFVSRFRQPPSKEELERQAAIARFQEVTNTRLQTLEMEQRQQVHVLTELKTDMNEVKDTMVTIRESLATLRGYFDQSRPPGRSRSHE